MNGYLISRASWCLTAAAAAAALAACSVGSTPNQGQPVVASSAGSGAGGSSAVPTIPAGVGPSPISSNQAKAFSDCMAAHGAPLASAGPGPSVGSSPPDQATIQKALAACRSLMPSGGAGSGPGGS